MLFKSVLITALASTAIAASTPSSTHSAGTAASTGKASSGSAVSTNGTQTFAVRVGMDATGKTVLKFSPDKITAPQGSVVQFQFMAGNHTVTQSAFDSPCAPISDTGASGFHSGFVPAAASLAKGEIPVYSITINDTKPIWLYCAQAKHCQGGMTMVINENTSANSSRSLANYSAAAAKATENKAPSNGKASGGTSGLAPAPAGAAAGTGTTGNAKATGSTNSTSPIATAGADRLAAPGLLAAAAVFLL